MRWSVAPWHERDISHSSMERFIGPDATITLNFALARRRGLVHSQQVLLVLTHAGIIREDA